MARDPTEISHERTLNERRGSHDPTDFPAGATKRLACTRTRGVKCVATFHKKNDTESVYVVKKLLHFIAIKPAIQRYSI